VFSYFRSNAHYKPSDEEVREVEAFIEANFSEEAGEVTRDEGYHKMVLSLRLFRGSLQILSRSARGHEGLELAFHDMQVSYRQRQNGLDFTFDLQKAVLDLY
jgi:hypothetical protein